MRLIDADALMENTFGVYTQEYGHIEVVGVDTIDAAPTIEPKRGEWIPVSEGLPENDESLNFYDDGRLKFTSVLCVTDGLVNIRNRLMVRKTGIPYLDEQATDGWVWGTGGNVTHWKPLPESPCGADMRKEEK